MLDSETLKDTYFLKPMLDQEQGRLRVRWVPGDLGNADVQLGVQLARSVTVYSVVAKGYANLPWEC